MGDSERTSDDILSQTNHSPQILTMQTYPFAFEKSDVLLPVNEASPVAKIFYGSNTESNTYERSLRRDEDGFVDQGWIMRVSTVNIVLLLTSPHR